MPDRRRRTLTAHVRRTEQRRAAVWALYQSDLLGRPLEETFPRDVHRFTRALAELVREPPARARRADLDATPRGWSLEPDRSAGALDPARRRWLEMLHPDDVPGEQPIPPEGAIDEAVETAKHFCGADAPGFVNGILGAVLRDRQQPPA